MHKLMGNLDIYFFFISILFILWTCQIHEWNGRSKPSNIHNIIKLFTVLHIVAKQPIKIAKATDMLIFVVAMVTSSEFLMLFLMLLQDNIFVLYIDHQKVIC